MKPIRTTILILLTAVSLAHAGIIGRVTFQGDFTLNHLYDFNNPGAQPFGTFSDQSVVFANGIFAPFIQSGQGVAGQQLWTEGPNNLPLFSIGNFSIFTDIVNITGPDSGRFVVGFSDLSGNGFQIGPDFFFWTFFAPPYDISNFPEDITGPITLQFAAFNTPDGGSTLTLMCVFISVLLTRPFLVALARRSPR